jgi:hypothetical protein
MTKLLSEIGVVGEFYRRLDPPFDVQILSVGDLKPGEKHYENVIVMNDDERRELVEKSIVRFITQEIESRTNLYILQTRLSAFLEEQGL